MSGYRPIFEVRDIGVTRGAHGLLDAVSLDVQAGELLVVMGENGAGKSTLLRVLAGDFAPDRGDVQLNGRPLSAWTALEQARQRAVLPQHASLVFPFTALEVVLMGRYPHDGGQPGAHGRAIAREAMRRTDALQFADRRYPTLSGGERARVMLARVFAQVLREDSRSSPRTLLLDEPSAALDISHQHLAFKAVRSMVECEGIGVVAVVHDPNLAAAYADRVVLLKSGRLMAIGTVDDTLTEDALGACFSVPIKRLRHPTRDVPLLVAAPD